MIFPTLLNSFNLSLLQNLENASGDPSKVPVERVPEQSSEKQNKQAASEKNASRREQVSQKKDKIPEPVGRSPQKLPSTSESYFLYFSFKSSIHYA